MPVMTSTLRDWRVISPRRAWSVDVFQSGLLQRLAHVVHVQSQYSGGELRALLAFIRFARCRSLQRLLRECRRHHHDAVIVGDDDIAWNDQGTGAHDRDVYGA